MHFKPKKGLGQNFLFDKNIQRKLITSYNMSPSSQVLEIGAGYGELTKLIARESAFVYALEIDTDIYKILKENTKEYPNIEIINEDILSFNLGSIFRRAKKKIITVGNIPYYITTPIIERLLRYRKKIKSIYITVQKEFAKRIVANPCSKEYGSFSCFVQYYSVPKILFYIKKGSFSPSPKVDSCLLEMKIREEPAVKVKDERLLFKIIRAAFNKRRKTLRNSLDGIIASQKLDGFFKERNIDNNTRPEDLSLADFANLANSLKKI